MLEVERVQSEQDRMTTQQRVASLHYKVDHLLSSIRAKDGENRALQQQQQQRQH
jgi:hypothetical protein